MPKFPEPPGINALKSIPPVLKHLSSGQLVWRIYFRGGSYPTCWDDFRHFGPTSARFDHHLPGSAGQPTLQDRGIMYLALDGPTCLAEVFQGTRAIDRQSRGPWLVGFKLQADIQLLDLTGIFSTAIGASAAIHSGPRPRAQRWAQQLYQAYPNIDGLMYCSSMYGNAPAIALFERGKPAIPYRPELHRALDDPALQYTLLGTGQNIGYQIV